jgi:hypothetical protein
VRIYLLLTAFIATSVAAVAQSSIRPGIFSERSLSGEPVRGRLDLASTSANGLTLGKSTLDDVEKKLGHARRFRLEKGEESSVGLCYLASDGRVAVVFASGPMGGWKDLDTLYLGTVSALTQAGASCARATGSVEASTQNGIRPGMNPAVLCSILHWKCKLRAGLINAYVMQQPSSVPAFTTYSGVHFAVKDGKVDWVEIFLIDTQ